VENSHPDQVHAENLAYQAGDSGSDSAILETFHHRPLGRFYVTHATVVETSLSGLKCWAAARSGHLRGGRELLLVASDRLPHSTW